MKFSIITPTFNARGCLAECVASVAAQDHPQVEHLVMDGGSTDGTAEWLAAQKDVYPRLKTLSEKDNGIYDAMNKGLRRATGDYVLFLGADDRLFSPATLSQILAVLGSERPAVVYGNVQTIGGGLRDVPDGGVYDGEFDFEKLLHKNICHQAVFYSREIVEKAGPYNVRYRFFADWDYNLRCYSLGTFRYVDVIVSRYNTSGRSTGGEDYNFHAAFFEEVRRYFGLSVFNRHYKDLAGYLGFAGKLRLRQLKDCRGLLYLAAAFWHSPRYLREQLGVLGAKVALGRGASADSGRAG